MKTVVILLFTVALLTVAYWPTFRWLVNSWLSNDHYSHGFLVPLVSGFFVWTKREYLQKKEPSLIGIFFLVAGVSLYILGFLWGIRIFGSFSLILILMAMVLLMFGIQTALAMVFPLAFLIAMIPFPFVQDITYYLQKISVASSVWLLSAIGLPVTSSGPDIFLGNITFFIGPPCSGTNTLIALLALAAVYAYILKGRLYKRLCLFIIALPVAIVANILRVTTIILVAHYVNIHTATGWYHTLANTLFFIMAFLVLILASRVMKCSLNYKLIGIK